MTYEKCLEYIKELNKGVSHLQAEQSLNKQVFTINTCQKLVFEDNGYIYKLESLRPIVSRILLYEYFEENRRDESNPFLKEEIVYYQFRPFEIAISKQKKVEVKQQVSEKEFLEGLSSTPKKLLNELNIRFFSDNNTGIDEDNNLKIFDYVGALWCEFIFDDAAQKKSTVLKNSKGVTIYKKEAWL